jgi:hypothetical protein
MSNSHEMFTMNRALGEWRASFDDSNVAGVIIPDELVEWISEHDKERLQQIYEYSKGGRK